MAVTAMKTIATPAEGLECGPRDCLDLAPFVFEIRGHGR